MGLRQRNGFDGIPQAQDVAREDLNLTKYDERYIMPTDTRAFSASDGGSGAFGASGVQAPAKSEESGFRDRNFIFGGDNNRESAFSTKPEERSYVLGGEKPQAPVEADARTGGGAFTANGGAAPVKSGERPMVFVMRGDGNMFVYEYSDRLEYYRRTEYGMSYMATKFKNLSR